MAAKRTSPIWQVGFEQLSKLVNRSSSITEILAYFGLKNVGCNYRTLRERCKELGIQKLPKGCNHNGLKREAIPLELVLIENSGYCRRHLKNRLIESGLLKECCSKCGLGTAWQGNPLVLVLDHINGTRNDNRLENLRLLCPNCHSQTPTFAGRARRRSFNCNICHRGITKHSKTGLCKECAFVEHRRKVKDRPSKATLLQQVQEIGYCGVGRLYGVSDNAVRKWLR